MVKEQSRVPPVEIDPQLEVTYVTIERYWFEAMLRLFKRMVGKPVVNEYKDGREVHFI